MSRRFNTSIRNKEEVITLTRQIFTKNLILNANFFGLKGLYQIRTTLYLLNENLQPDLRFDFRVLTPFPKSNLQLSNDPKFNRQPSKPLILNCQPSKGSFPLRHFSSFALHFTLGVTVHAHGFLTRLKKVIHDSYFQLMVSHGCLCLTSTNVSPCHSREASSDK